jgi:threonine dehydratase
MDSSCTDGPLPTEDDVVRAAERIASILPPTPVHRAERLGARLKLENLQRTGSYKVRGALNALLTGAERGDRRPVLAASAGNHAQGVAWAARRLGLRAIAVMPESAPQTKIRGVTRLGAEVILHGRCFDEAQSHARELAARCAYRLIHPFDDADVIAGQGSVGVELLSHKPDVVLVPIGGGGLAAGVALAMKAHGVKIVGVQLAGVDSMARTLRGDPTPIEPAATMADGVRVRQPGLLTRRILARLLDDIIIVTEREMRQALLRLATEERIVAEGAGALAVAALSKVPGRRKFALVSGGNIDAAVLAMLLADMPPPARRRTVRRETALAAVAL